MAAELEVPVEVVRRFTLREYDATRSDIIDARAERKRQQAR